MNYCIPLLLLILSLSCQMGYCSISQTVFQDERIFPFEKKATAINFIIFISKVFTVGASFVNELNEPLPIIFIIVLAFLGLLLIGFFPTREEQKKMEIMARAKLLSERSKHQSSKHSSGVSLEQAA